MYSQATKEAISIARTLSGKYKEKEPVVKSLGTNASWFPILGVFLDADRKLFAVRSNAEETTPRVYKFSQLQSFEVSEDVRSSRMGGAVTVGWLTIGGFAGASGSVSMRVVISGTNGPETVDLKPELFSVWGKVIKTSNIKTNSPLYKIKCEELAAIADCLQWIINNA